MVKNIEDEIAIKIPKLIPDYEQESMGLLDLIFQTQMMQFLKSSSTSEESVFFSQV